MVYTKSISCIIFLGDSNMIDFVSIGRKIKMYRKNCKKTQAQLAEELEVSAKYVSSIERGIAKVSLSRLDEIAGILNVTVSDLLEGSDKYSQSYGDSELLELTKNWSSEQKTLLISVITALNENRL